MPAGYTETVSGILDDAVKRLSFAWSKEPLDADTTTELGNMFLLKLDLANGNILASDYEAEAAKYNFEYLNPKSPF